MYVLKKFKFMERGFLKVVVKDNFFNENIFVWFFDYKIILFFISYKYLLLNLEIVLVFFVDFKDIIVFDIDLFFDKSFLRVLNVFIWIFFIFNSLEFLLLLIVLLGFVLRKRWVLEINKLNLFIVILLLLFCVCWVR